MGVLISTGLEVLASALVFVPLYLVLNKRLFQSPARSVFCCIFSLYLAAVYTLVGIPNVTYIRFAPKLNLIPFVDMMRVFRSSFLNVLLFVPLGVMLPLGWGNYRKTGKSLLFGFLMSLTIELLQMFTYRATDVNDLITNTLGTFLGFVAGRLVMKTVPELESLIGEGTKRELLQVCGISFAVMFFVHPFLSAGMWNWIYS